MSAKYLYLDRRKFEVTRAKKQISMQELSKATRCGARYFSGNPIRVTVLVAGRVADFLGVDLDWLLADVQDF